MSELGKAQHGQLDSCLDIKPVAIACLPKQAISNKRKTSGLKSKYSQAYSAIIVTEKLQDDLVLALPAVSF